MSTFQLSPQVDANTVFLVRHNQLLSRWDATAYKQYFRFKSFKFPVEKLGKIAFLNPKVSYSKIDENDLISFVPMENIDEINGVVKEAKFKLISETKGFTRFEEGDLIWAKITPCMQNGKSAVVRNLNNGYGCGSTEFFVLRPRSSNLLIDYLYILLRDERILHVAQNYFGGSAGQQRVSSDFLLNLDIPLPPIKTQQKIVDLYSDALQHKQQKEQQAAALLASIDGYLLGELGISLPEQDNRLEKRIFRVRAREVSGGRFDPKLYDTVTQGLKSNIRLSSFEQKPLRLLLTQSVAGDWGKDIDESADDCQKCLVIRSTEFDNQFNLNLDGKRAKYRLINKAKLQKIDIQVNDLLIEKSGGSPDQPVGRVALITQEYINTERLCYSNFIHKIRVDSSIVEPIYLFEFLRTMHNIKLTEAMQSQTNGIRNLIMGSFFAQSIVLPPLETQQKIFQQIQSIRAQAAQLQAEAAQILFDAKAQVERMIVGEVDVR